MVLMINTDTSRISPYHGFYLSLQLLSKASLLPCVQENEFQVQAGPEHEHVAVEFDLCDTTGRQGVADGHQTHSLIAGLIQGHVHHVLTHFQVAAAVDDLGTAAGHQGHSTVQRDRESATSATPRSLKLKQYNLTMFRI